MTAPSSFDRRMFLKWASALPLFGYMAAQDAANKLWGKAASDNIYTRIGVRPFINARGTWTYLSGSLELPEVKAAKQAAAGHFVEIFELQRGVGKRLAELSGAESGMIASGASGAIASATAGCIAGTDPAKVWQLPDTTGMKGEVVMHGGRTPFDSAVRLAGAKLVLAYSHDELAKAMGPNTAMIYTTALGEKLEKAIAIAKNANVPLLLDDAAGIPPIENLKLYAKMGADMYTFSGGKGLSRPAVLWYFARSQNPHRCRAGQFLPVGRRAVPADESRQRGNHGVSGGGRVLDEGRPRRAQSPMGRAGRAHPEAGGHSAGRENRNPRSGRRQPLSHAAGDLGRGGMEIFRRRLRPQIA